MASQCRQKGGVRVLRCGGFAPSVLPMQAAHDTGSVKRSCIVRCWCSGPNLLLNLCVWGRQGALPLQALLQAAQAAPLPEQAEAGAAGAGQPLAPAWGAGAGGAMMQVRQRSLLLVLLAAPAARGILSCL